jgi:hypothetical protein
VFFERVWFIGTRRKHFVCHRHPANYFCCIKELLRQEKDTTILARTAIARV